MTEQVFKGSRDYLHSTTVFDWIIARGEGLPESIDFSFNRKTDRKCRMVSPEKVGDAVVVGSWKDKSHELRIVETHETILERRPYDEDAIGRACYFDDALVRIPAHIGDKSFIERLVGAYKALLLRQEGLSQARLAFVRLQLEHVPEGEIDVRFERRMGDFFQGSISSSGTRIGRIYFGRWK